MTNRYPGKCGTCGQWVEANAGTVEKIGGRWVAKHEAGQCPAPQAAEVRNTVKAECGVYRTQDGRIYVVRERKFPDSDGPVRYAREIVALSEDAADRISEDGAKARYQEVKAPGMVWKLTAADALPLADFQALCQHYEQCMACGITLRAAKSLEEKIGPVCGGRQRKLDRAREARMLEEVVA